MASGFAGGDLHGHFPFSLSAEGLIDVYKCFRGYFSSHIDCSRGAFGGRLRGFRGIGLGASCEGYAGRSDGKKEMSMIH